jgi:hypothetical protein
MLQAAWPSGGPHDLPSLQSPLFWISVSNAAATWMLTVQAPSPGAGLAGSRKCQSQVGLPENARTLFTMPKGIAQLEPTPLHQHAELLFVQMIVALVPCASRACTLHWASLAVALPFRACSRTVWAGWSPMSVIHNCQGRSSSAGRSWRSCARRRDGRSRPRGELP